MTLAAVPRAFNEFLPQQQQVIGRIKFYDRVLAVNMFGTKTVLLIAVYGFLTDRPEFLDLAIVYALINFIGVIAVLRFSRFGHFADSDAGGEKDTDAGKEA